MLAIFDSDCVVRDSSQSVGMQRGKLARTIADRARCKEILSVHLAALPVRFAKTLHLRQTKVDAQHSVMSYVQFIYGNSNTNAGRPLGTV